MLVRNGSLDIEANGGAGDPVENKIKDRLYLPVYTTVSLQMPGLFQVIQTSTRSGDAGYRNNE